MNEHDLTCKEERRRHDVRAHDLNGLDYVEVSDDQLRLTVTFLGKAPEGITPRNVRITGGRRIRDVAAVEVIPCRAEDPERDDCLIIIVNKPGDFSTYTLCLIDLDEDGHPIDRPFPGIDPRYACLDLNFKIGCPSELDCKPRDVCPPDELDEPVIDYLAKDYASFRRLILDRLALIMPEWKERHVPDLGIALVELLAYTGDYLSYYQDAVATEAYLDTARQRISVRRHARLVDYPMHEGCNARAWVYLHTDTDWSLNPEEVTFITGTGLLEDAPLLVPDDLRAVPRDAYEVFEPMTHQAIPIYADHSEIHLYTWGDHQCCLPRGATSATLTDHWIEPNEETKPPDPEQTKQEQVALKTPPPKSAKRERELRHLKAGDVLIFEEVIGPETGNEADADPTHRHAVRLTRVEPGVDPLFDQPIVEIEWAREDALPFPLCISTVGPAPECEHLTDVSVARGNVILVDHGESIQDEELGTVGTETTDQVCKGEGRPSDVTVLPGRFGPVLDKGPLTFSQLLPAGLPASRALAQAPRKALPQVRLTGTYPAPGGEIITEWIPRRDLLGSDGKDRHFVAEIDDGGRAHLRFGDGELGETPEAGAVFSGSYRVGNGPAGNVGAGAISHIVFQDNRPSGIDLRPRNPLPARGGVAPETLAEVKFYAPHAFRIDLQRAVTADDYAQIVMRDFQPFVQRAAAILRWTGSWYEVLVAVDPRGGTTAPPGLLERIEAHLYRFRRIGHDVAVRLAKTVSLDVELTVCVAPDHLRGHVKAALIDTFSNRRLPSGQLGFFHPDNLTFGEGITVSNLVATAQAVPGVANAIIEKLERLYEGPNGEIEAGILPLGPFEIARLDNDPSFPENGRFRLFMRGGR